MVWTFWWEGTAFHQVPTGSLIENECSATDWRCLYQWSNELCSRNITIKLCSQFFYFFSNMLKDTFTEEVRTFLILDSVFTMWSSRIQEHSILWRFALHSLRTVSKTWREDWTQKPAKLNKMFHFRICLIPGVPDAWRQTERRKRSRLTAKKFWWSFNREKVYTKCLE